MLSHDFLTDFKARGHIVIVGASLTGLNAAETLRSEGFGAHSPSSGTNPISHTIARRSRKAS
jgi:hypothetical protein